MIDFIIHRVLLMFWPVSLLTSH